MDEILELRRSVEEGRYNDALTLIGEMEEMAKDDKIVKIGSFAVILLVHLLKQDAEKCLTRSWKISIKNALSGIAQSNKRRSSGGHYLRTDELAEMLEENIAQALRIAASEALKGKYSEREFAKLVDAKAVKAQALDYILNGYPESED
jgi:hypothetical protein